MCGPKGLAPWTSLLLLLLLLLLLVRKMETPVS